MGIEHWFTAVLPLPSAPGLAPPDCDGHVQLGIFLLAWLSFCDSVKVGLLVQIIPTEAETGKGNGLLVWATGQHP